MTEPTHLGDFSDLAFEDTFVRALPGETPAPELARRSREVLGACWAAVCELVLLEFYLLLSWQVWTGRRRAALSSGRARGGWCGREARGS